MLHAFNAAVVYTRNGNRIPAIVLKSQSTDAGELLTLLYADPETGPVLVAQGTTRGIGSVANAVPPLEEGKVFGWERFGPDAEVADRLEQAETIIATQAADLRRADQLATEQDEKIAALEQQLQPQITDSKVSEPSVADLDAQADEQKAKEATSATEQIDEAQGPIEPGYPESPAAIDVPAEELKTE